MSHPRGAHRDVPVERIERLRERFGLAQSRLHTARRDMEIAWMLFENVATEIEQIGTTKKPPVLTTQAA